MVRSRLRALVLVVSLAALAALPAAAQTKPKVTDTGVAKPISAIFIGNSFFYYNNGLPGHLRLLLRAADASFHFIPVMVTISGSGMDWHDVDSYFRPNAIGKYSFDQHNNVVFQKPREPLFDVAVIMDCSQCPVNPDLKGVFFEYAKRNAESVRRHGTQPVFFMSWAYKDRPEMTEQLAEAYTQAGNDNNAMVIPAGLAVAKAVRQHPDVNLYAADKRHPSPAGTYLAANVTYAALFWDSPVGINYTAGLDAETAKVLQTIAWDTVREYYGTPRSSAKAD